MYLVYEQGNCTKHSWHCMQADVYLSSQGLSSNACTGYTVMYCIALHGLTVSACLHGLMMSAAAGEAIPMHM